jgi:predicted RNA-binding Zn-ribbon protein involved in translation (DUF1610 family)
MAIPTGNDSTATGTIVLTNEPGVASPCLMNDCGEYSIVYAPDCRTARWTLVSDTCTARSNALDGASFTRL